MADIGWLLAAGVLLVVGLGLLLWTAAGVAWERAQGVLEAAKPRTWVRTWAAEAAEARTTAAGWARAGRPDVACALSVAHLGFVAAGGLLDGRVGRETLPAELRKLAAELERQQTGVRQ